MAMFHIGTLIKEQRTGRGATLDQLCKGICHRTTLMRIEVGERTPNNFVLAKLLERLGFHAERFYFSGQSEIELRFFNLYYEIEGCIMVGELADVATKVFKLEQLHQEMNRSETESKIRQQMIMVMKCALAQKEKEEASKRIEDAKNALGLTLGSFNEVDVSKLMISYDEISLLNMLAAAYGENGETDREINLLYRTKESMDKYHIDEYEKSRGYILTLFNLSTVLGFAGRHEESLEITNIAIKYCVIHRRLNLLPALKFNKACSLHFLGSDENYRRLAIEAVYSLRNNEQYTSAAKRKEFAEREMGIVFPFW
ncbi:MAG: helix-turn-helix domain-containing protein [Defluviitaleaceae bacterium]|nr:helix-turn-helix domain-containing protein [Defluviitaleaceae bacterium]